jgi:hypothetical protein
LKREKAKYRNEKEKINVYPFKKRKDANGSKKIKMKGKFRKE